MQLQQDNEPLFFTAMNAPNVAVAADRAFGSGENAVNPKNA
jgi:hypothetical protein